MPGPNIAYLAKTRQDLPLSDRQIGALEPSLYGTIIHARGSYLTSMRYIEYVTKKTK